MRLTRRELLGLGAGCIFAGVRTLDRYTYDKEVCVMTDRSTTGGVAAAMHKLPSGPECPGPFGAFYAHLRYSREWDGPWRVADHPDVVVRFDDGGHRFVFWRGTSYIPCWVTDAGVWYTNEFVERRGAHSPNTKGCVEPMSDKQCRFSHVRVIESTDARTVVHWRYAPVDVRYEHPFTDPITGWSDWVDEYYTIYPNAVGVRHITVHTGRTDLWCEFQESIVVNQPGTSPDENIELGAVSLANMQGESKTYMWPDDGKIAFGEPERANIVKINAKGSIKPFALVAPQKGDGILITPYQGHGRGSRFNFWDHWPVSQDASDGRAATTVERPSHSSLCHIGLPGMATAEWEPYVLKEGEEIQKLMLHGLTDKPVEGLVPLAKSWLNPAKLVVRKGHVREDGYDPRQMAYVLIATSLHEPSALEVDLLGSNDSPILNPAILVKGWDNSPVSVELNGVALQSPQDYRVGYRETLETSDLILWIEKEAADPMRLGVSPTSG